MSEEQTTSVLDSAAARRSSPGDWLIALALAVLAAAAVWFAACGLDELLVRGENHDIWFEGDCARVFENITDAKSVQSRAAVHPVFTLCMYLPVAVLRWAGLEPIVAVRVMRALTAAACLAVFYGLLRAMRCRRVDGVLLSLLAASSAGAMFWFAVPETYPAGLLTILLALGLAALSETRRLAPAWDVVVNVATASVTITNWMVGLLATVVRWPAKRALLLIVASAVGVLFLMAVQHAFFPSAAWLPVSPEERSYVLHPDAGGPARVAPAFVFHSMVMPAIETTVRYGEGSRPVMSVQHSMPGSASAWGRIGVVLWAVLLGCGVYGMIVCRGHRRLRLVLVLAIAGQLGLHLLYGLETFTYACHFGPLLIVVAAFATLTPVRRVALVLVAALLVCAVVNNTAQFRRAASSVEAVVTSTESAGAR